MAIDPTGVDFSLEVRPYSLIQLLCAVQIYCYLGLIALGRGAPVRSRLGHVVCFAGLTTVLAYLHYLSLLILLPEVAYSVILLRTVNDERSTRQLRDVATVIAISVLTCIPLIPHLRYLVSARSVLGSFVPRQPLYISLSYFHSFQYLLFPLPFILLLEYIRRHRDNDRNLSVFESTPHRLGSGDGFQLLFVFLWLYLPTVFVWSSTQIGLARIDLPRYVACSATAPIIACVSIGMRLTSHMARLSLLAMALSAVQLFHPWNHYDPGGRLRAICEVRPDYRQHRETVDFINRECRNGFPVLVVSSLVESDWLGTQITPELNDYLLCEVDSLSRIEITNPKRLLAPLAWSRSERLSQRDSVALYRQSIVRNGGFYLFTPGHADVAVSDRDIREILEAPFTDPEKRIVDVVSQRLCPKLTLFTISLRSSTARFNDGGHRSGLRGAGARQRAAIIKNIAGSGVICRRFVEAQSQHQANVTDLYRLESPTADNVETDKNDESTLWAGRTAAVEILDTSRLRKPLRRYGQAFRTKTTSYLRQNSAVNRDRGSNRQSDQA